MSGEPQLERLDVARAHPVTLVWIDADQAVLVRWRGNRAQFERVASEVPARHRAIGHVRHDPAVRHGGGGPQDAGEAHRLEHLRRFILDIANRVAPADDLLIVGPGSVHERLARHLDEGDKRRGFSRDVACGASPPLTDRQLVARLRRFAGDEPRRRTVGAHRWGAPPGLRPSGRAELLPHRVSEKATRERRRDAARG